MSEQQADYKIGDGKYSTKRALIFDKSGGRCWYCGSVAEQVDHVNPVILGGKDNIDNLVPVCKWCNKSKRGYPLEVWRQRLALKMGIAFTEEQKNYWGKNIPADHKYIFFFEREGL